ncbi:uncharacterized protein [Manis javanica]|uniref:uncharacterized protein n=1 Tax=Manis javanica TaxID=9974 RepID=UPI003C6D8028
MSNARMTHYQTLLLNRDRVEFAPPAILNPATLLPDLEKEVLHTCQEILAEETGTRQDLQDQPLGGTRLLTWYTDGSSYIMDGKRMAGAAVVDDDRVVWASGLPTGTSAQRAELIALTQALKMAEGKRLNVYTDSRYAFATAHIHGAIYRQRGLLTSAGKDVKNKQEILDLLEAIHRPKEVAIMHCPGHQKDDSPIARGNRRADQAAKQAAQGMNILPLQVCPEATHIESFQYTPEDLVCINKLGFKNSSPQEIYKSEKGKVVLPRKEAEEYLRQLHQLTHLGAKNLKTLVRDSPYHIIGLGKLADEIVKNCVPCQLVNVSKNQAISGKRLRGDRPGTYWEVDFTEIKPAKYRYKYLLVFLDTFSGWTEAFPTKTETAQTVSKKILEEIFPRFGIPKVIGSDNGPAFVAQVTSLGGCAERGVGLHQGSLSARRPLGASPVPGGRPSLREKAPDRKPRATVEGTFHRPPDYSHSCKSGRRLFLDTRFTSKEGTPGPGLASNSD